MAKINWNNASRRTGNPPGAPGPGSLGPGLTSAGLSDPAALRRLTGEDIDRALAEIVASGGRMASMARGIQSRLADATLRLSKERGTVDIETVLAEVPEVRPFLRRLVASRTT